METKDEDGGVRTPTKRQGGSTPFSLEESVLRGAIASVSLAPLVMEGGCPATPRSLVQGPKSYDGLPLECTAGSRGASTPAKNIEERERRQRGEERNLPGTSKETERGRSRSRTGLRSGPGPSPERQRERRTREGKRRQGSPPYYVEDSEEEEEVKRPPPRKKGGKTSRSSSQGSAKSKKSMELEASDAIVEIEESEEEVNKGIEMDSLNGDENSLKGGNDPLMDEGEEEEEEEKFRGRERPVKTGEREEKKARDDEKGRLEEERRLEELGDPGVRAELSRKRKVKEIKAREECKRTPIADLAGRIHEAVCTVDKVSIRAGNLKGTDKGFLNSAAATISAAITELMQRTEEKDSFVKNAEIEELREQLKAVREENKKLREMMDKLKIESEQAKKKEDAKIKEENEKLRGMIERLKIAKDTSKRREEAMDVDEDIAQQPWIEESGREEQETAEDRKKREAAERNRLRMLREIEEEGAPEARRPQLGGVRKLIEKAIPPKTEKKIERKPEVGTAEEKGLEERLLDKMTKKMEEMLGEFVAGLGAVLPRKVENQNARTDSKERKKVENKKEDRNKNKEKENKGRNGKEGKPKEKERQTKQGDKTSSTPIQEAIPEPAATPSTSKAASEQPTWSTVVRKGSGVKARTREMEKTAGKTNKTANTAGTRKQQEKGSVEQSKGNGKKKLPRTAAISITSDEDNLDKLMKEARERITLEELREMGIEGGLRPKRAQTGALLIEIPGQEGSDKADALANRMAEVFAGRQGVKVSRPMKMGEIRVLDIEDSFNEAEIASAIATTGECGVLQIQTGQMRIGPNGLRTMWARCPQAAVNKIVSKGGRINTGWFVNRVQVLDARPLQCYKCMESGHVRAQCTSDADRSTRCYRCGEEGHSARGCNSTPRCPLCADLGKLDSHRVGGKACEAAKRRRRPNRVVTRKLTNGETREGEERMETEPLRENEPKPQRKGPRVQSVERANIPIPTLRAAMKRAATLSPSDEEDRRNSERRTDKKGKRKKESKARSREGSSSEGVNRRAGTSREENPRSKELPASEEEEGKRTEASEESDL